MKKCILCQSEKVKVSERIKSELLKNIYYDTLNIDISKELQNENEIKLYNCKNCRLDFFDPKFAGEASFYEELQLKRKIYYSSGRKEFDIAAQFISKKDSVLEIGSGSGFFAQKINNDNYVGLEFNDEAIKKAAENQIKLVKQSIESYAAENEEKFDVVCSFHVLEHVQDPYEFLKASISKMNPAGKLILAVPCNDSVLTSNHNHILNLPPHHITRWKLSSLQKIITVFDLKIVDFRVISIPDAIDKKQYVKAVLLKKVLNVLYPKNKIVINPEKLNRVKRWTNFLVTRLRLYKMYKQKNLIGENVMFVFERK